MKSSTKWLIGFGGVIVALVVTAVIMVAVMAGSDKDLPGENTPEGVVMRYFQALNDKDYETAYSYLSQDALSENQWLDTYSEWLIDGTRGYNDSENAWKVELGEIHRSDITTSIEVEITVLQPDLPFATNRYTQIELFQLSDLEDGWKITSPLGIPYQIR